jgi:hypothetical protein
VTKSLLELLFPDKEIKQKRIDISFSERKQILRISFGVSYLGYKYENIGHYKCFFVMIKYSCSGKFQREISS